MTKKLKTIAERKPTRTKAHAQMVIDVSRDTGFKNKDVALVLSSYVDHLRKEMLQARSVRIKNTCIMMPMVKPPRQVMNMSTNEPKYMEARWSIVFKLESGLIKEMKEMDVTSRDLNNIYHKD
jgi:nucleoid DNA-binding protein